MGASGVAMRICAVAAGTLVLVVAGSGMSRADVDESSTGADREVVRVGSVAITAQQLERRLATVPRYQLAAYASSEQEIKRAYVERVLVPELLLSLGARERGLTDDPAVQFRMKQLLQAAVLMQVRQEAPQPEQVPQELVAKYFADHADEYQKPATYVVSRILVSTRAEAERLLEQLLRERTLQKWNDLARQHSIDPVTDLGMLTDEGVARDGTSKADALLMEAVRKVSDGELVREALPQGTGFAVVWRRGSSPRVQATLSQQEPQIRQALSSQAARQATENVIARLKERELRVVNEKGRWEPWSAGLQPQFERGVEHWLALADFSRADRVTPSLKPQRLERRPGRTGPQATQRGLR